MELFKEDFNRIENEIALSFKRYPDLKNVSIKNWVNGAFTFSPDGNPLVGPVRGIKNYWLARGVMVGFLQGGGVGKPLSEWMIYGETETDAEVEANGYEFIWSKNNERIGMITSGSYGHNVDKSLAMALVKPNFSEPGIELKAHIVGKEKHCVVLSSSPWDPKGLRMRS